MNSDAIKLAEFGEAARHNREQERIDAQKADAATMQARASRLKSRADALKGVVSLAGNNDADGWYNPGESELGNAGAASFVQFETGVQKRGIAYRHVPSVQAFHMEQTLGVGSYNQFFLASKHIYDICRGHNKGATNYTVNDLMAYLFFAMSSTSLINQLDRAVKVYSSPDPVNLVTVTQMLEILGFDFESFKANIENIKQAIDQVKATLNVMKLPIDFPLWQRWSWLESFVFMDDEHRLKQYYVFGFDNRHRIGHTSDPHYVSSLVALPFKGSASATMSASDVFAAITALQNDAKRVMYNATYQAIAGDIEHAFEGKCAPLCTYTDWKDDPYILDEEIKLQISNVEVTEIKNPTLLPFLTLKLDVNGELFQGLYTSTGDKMDIMCTTPVAYSGYYDQGSPLVMKSQVVGDLSPIDVVMATRFKPELKTGSISKLSYYYYDPSDHTLKAGTVDAPSNYVMKNILSAGTELVVQVTVHYTDNDIDDPDHLTDDGANIFKSNYVNLEDYNTTSTLFALRSYSVTIPFLGHPDSNLDDNPSWICPMDSFAIITAAQLRNMHYAANLAIWGYRTLHAESGSSGARENRKSGRNDRRRRKGGKRDVNPQGNKQNTDQKGEKKDGDNPTPKE